MYYYQQLLDPLPPHPQKVNANVKKSDQDLVNLKANFDMVFDASRTLAPGLNIAVATEGGATPSSSLMVETP